MSFVRPGHQQNHGVMLRNNSRDADGWRVHNEGMANYVLGGQQNSRKSRWVESGQSCIFSKHLRCPLPVRRHADLPDHVFSTAAFAEPILPF